MNTKQIPLTPQERTVVEEAFQPFLQAITIIAKLRGLNPQMAQLTADRTAFVVPDETPVSVSDVLENGMKSFG